MKGNFYIKGSNMCRENAVLNIILSWTRLNHLLGSLQILFRRVTLILNNVISFVLNIYYSGLSS